MSEITQSKYLRGREKEETVWWDSAVRKSYSWENIDSWEPQGLQEYRGIYNPGIQETEAGGFHCLSGQSACWVSMRFWIWTLRTHIKPFMCIWAWLKMAGAGELLTCHSSGTTASELVRSSETWAGARGEGVLVSASGTTTGACTRTRAHARTKIGEE